MSTGGRNAIVAALVALGLALLAAWWLRTHERVERTVDLQPRGEARYNPLYALKLALREAGVRAQSRQRLRLGEVPLGAGDTLLVLSDPRTLSPREVDDLLRWVQGGGHLLVRTPPRQDSFATAPETRNGLLSALALRPVPKPGCMRLAAPRSPAKTRHAPASPYLFCGSTRFTMEGVEPLQAWGDLDNGYAYARLAHGEGTVDVLADFDFLDNDSLEQPAFVLLARQLLQPGWKRGTVHLVYAASMPPLWRLLLDRAWMAWLPLLLAMCAWLWMRTQRFGPRVPSPEPARRALLEHVQASGEHLWRYGRAATLHGAVRDALLARLRRRDPVAAALEGELQAAAIAARTGVPAAEVLSALRTPRPRDGADFTRRIARLLQLRQRL